MWTFKFILIGILSLRCVALTVETGQTVTIECPLEGTFPRWFGPPAYTALTNGSKVTVNLKFVTEKDLMITNVTREHTGNYSCQQNNSDVHIELIVNDEDGTITESQDILLPPDLVPGSERASAFVIGYILCRTLPNLKNLLRRQYVSGEQNMPSLSPNIYVLQYLKSTYQDTPKPEAEAKNYTLTGVKEDTRPIEEIVRDKLLHCLESAYPNILAVEDLVRIVQADKWLVVQELGELQNRNLIRALETGGFVRHVLDEKTEVQEVKQMATVTRHQQPTIAVISANYCEKLAVDAMLENKTIYVKFI